MRNKAVFIVKETDEESIAKATELAGRQSKKLADTIKDILALRGKDELDVEIIEEAIDILDGKKKETDLLPCQPLKDFTYVSPWDKLQSEFVSWGIHHGEPKEPSCIARFEKPKEAWRIFTEILTDRVSVKEPARAHEEICAIFTGALDDQILAKPRDFCSCNMRVFLSKSRASPYRGRKIKKIRRFSWDYRFKDPVIHTDFVRDKLPERRLVFARSR